MGVIDSVGPIPQKPPRHKKATTLRAVLANLVRDLRVWW